VNGADKPMSLLADFEQALIELVPKRARRSACGWAARNAAIPACVYPPWLVERPAGGRRATSFTSVPDAVAFPAQSMHVMDILSKPPRHPVGTVQNKQKPAPAIAPTRAW